MSRSNRRESDRAISTSSKRQKRNENSTKESEPTGEISTTSDSVLDLSTLSDIEKLPRDVIWRILKYVPEAVMQLRLTSKLIKTYVDEFALLAVAIPVVEYLEITFRGKRGTSGRLRGSIHIYYSMSSLFELRLALHPKLRGLFHPKREVLLTACVIYKYCIEAINEHANLLNECIGKTIEWMSFTRLYNAPPPHPSPVLHEILKGVAVTRLSFHLNILDESDTIHIYPLFPFAARIMLLIDTISVANPRDFMALLTSNARVIDIVSYEKEGDFVGIPSSEWPSIVIEMFSRQVKTVKLTCKESLVLDQQCVAALREYTFHQLPKLGKKIWFKAECTIISNDLDYIQSDHHVKVNREELAIMHSTRMCERDPFKAL